MASSPTRRNADGPGAERTITLTDAVVAIAMTLLILPLVEISGEVDPDNLREFLDEHGDLLLSFVISFVVIFAFWSAHAGIYKRLTEAGLDHAPGLGTLNLLWLLVIAFLPFPTALTGKNLNTSTAPIYIGTMLVLSLITSGLSVVVSRACGEGQRISLAWLTTAVFALCTVVAFFAPSLAMYLLFLLIVVRVLEVRLGQRRSVFKPSD